MSVDGVALLSKYRMCLNKLKCLVGRVLPVMTHMMTPSPPGVALSTNEPVNKPINEQVFRKQKKEIL